MYCKNCGKELKEDAAFCDSCGERVGVVSDVAEVGVSAGRQKRHIVLIAGILLAALIAVGVATRLLPRVTVGQSVSSGCGVGVPAEPEFKVSKRTSIDVEGLKTINEYSYDSQGRVTTNHKTEEYKTDGGDVKTAVTDERITYVNDTEATHEKTVAEAKKPSDNGTFRMTEHRTLNDKGDCVENYIEEFDGSTTTVNSMYEYHANGKKKSAHVEYHPKDYVDDGTTVRVVRSDATYDDYENLLSSHEELSDGTIVDEECTYNDSGVLASRVRHYKSGDYYSDSTYTYDEYGNEASEVDVSKQNSGEERRIEREYELALDSEGRVLRRVEPQADDGKGGGSGRAAYEYEYDSNGNEAHMRCELYAHGSDDMIYSNEVFTEYVRV